MCADEVSVDHWNELNDEYAFVYANPEKGSEKVLVKCLVMNDKLLVHALTQGSSEPISLEIEYLILFPFFLVENLIVSLF